MNLGLERASVKDKPIVERLLQLHLYDADMEPGPDGLIDFDEPLEGYFGSPGYVAVLFKVDGQLAGFALLRLHRKPAGPDGITPLETHVVEAFQVMRPFRRKGIGTRAMDLIRRDYPGRWTITSWPGMHHSDDRAAFWRSVTVRSNGREFGPEEHHGFVGQYVWVIEPEQQERK